MVHYHVRYFSDTYFPPRFYSGIFSLVFTVVSLIDNLYCHIDPFKSGDFDRRFPLAVIYSDINTTEYNHH